MATAQPQVTVSNGKATVKFPDGQTFKYDSVEEAIEAMATKAAKASRPTTISAKVAEKGGLSVYGLGRFPVTLYKSQWERLIAGFDPEWLNLPGLKDKD